jgi:hypothetical protein
MGVSSILLTCTLFVDNVRSHLSVFVVLSVSLYVCVCVCTLFAGFLLSCDGQNNGSAIHTRADILGDQIISLHTVSPERFVMQPVKKFLFL